MSGLGAGIGAIASPGHAGLGATRGAAYGAGTGLMEDLGLRKAAMGGEANQQKLDLENTKTRALIGEWGNKARYRDAMAKLGYAKFNLDEAKYGRYAEDVETFAKSWYQANPDGTQEQFTAALNFKFPEMFVGKDPEKTNITAAPVVGTPAKQGWFGTSVGATPAKPGMYNQQQIPNKLPGETREAYQQRTGLKVE
jgi:hypothetical protein